MEWEPSYQKHCRQPETIKEPSICSCRTIKEPSICSCRLSCLMPWALVIPFGFVPPGLGFGKTDGRLKRCEDPEWNSPHPQALDYREEPWILIQ